MRIWLFWLVMAVFVLNVLDIISTEIGVRMGGKELNPTVIKLGFKRAWGLKMGICLGNLAAAIWILHVAAKRVPGALLFCALLGVGYAMVVYVWYVICNGRELLRLYRYRKEGAK